MYEGDAISMKKNIICQFEGENDRAAAYDDTQCEVGECTFSRRDNYWSIDHTFVEPELRGQNVAESLVQTIVHQARKEDVKINPVCSFAKKELTKNKEYQDILLKS